MGEVTVVPQEWKYVDFDSDRIALVATTLLEAMRFDTDLRIEVEESSPLGHAKVSSVDPLVLQVQGGAFEDAKRPRQLSERGVADVLGRLLFRSRDRLDHAFGEPPPDPELTLAQSTAWDAYCLGRAAHLGYPSQRQRRLYHFRNRHGFTDVADAAFERLWTSDDLIWADLEAINAETAAARA